MRGIIPKTEDTVAEEPITYGKFRFIKAESPELKEQIYRLRYATYVEEFGFEDPRDHPGGLETDIYDDYSIHFAALNESDEVIGTIRLILASPHGFPIETVGPLRFVGQKPSPGKIAEISRLAVSRNYRRRREDGPYGLGSYLPLGDASTRERKDDRRKRPIILLGLFQLMYHASKRLGLTHWYMITEDKVHCLLSKFGFVFHAIGEPVHYHGLRTPYVGIIKEMEENFARKNPELFKKILHGLEEKYHPKWK